MGSGLIISILAVIIAIQLILHFFERKDLYNRLMSRDLTDYKRVVSVGADKDPRKTAHEKAIDKWRSGQ
jgi:hypothetical protein